LSIVQLSVTIEPTILVFSKSTVVLEDVQHGGETRKDESLTLVFVALLQELVHELHLTASFDEMVSKFRSTLLFDTLEQVRVIANFSQLYQNVLVVACGSSFVNGTFLEQLSVDRFLGLRDSYLDVHLDLGQETLLYFSLDSTEHEWSQDLMKLLHHLGVFYLFFFVGQLLIAFCTEIKPLIEIVRRGENFR
jgi:hypothetical protein